MQMSIDEKSRKPMLGQLFFQTGGLCIKQRDLKTRGLENFNIRLGNGIFATETA